MLPGIPKSPKKRIGRNRPLLWGLGAALFIWCFFSLTNKFQHLSVGLRNERPFPKITDTYHTVFPGYDSTKTVPSYTFFSAFKDPKSTFAFKKGAERILVYKIGNINGEIPINKVLRIVWNPPVFESTDYVYDQSFRSPNFVFSDLEAKSLFKNQLYLNISGKNIGSPLINDSLVHYTIDLKSIGGRYSPVAPYDFLCKKTERLSGRTMQVEMAFLRKKSIMYMLLLLPANESFEAGTGQELLKLITANKS